MESTKRGQKDHKMATKKKRTKPPKPEPKPKSKPNKLAVHNNRPQTILAIPDCHIRPGERFDDRAHYLSSLILENRPDTLILLGDIWEMESCCAYNITPGSKVNWGCTTHGQFRNYRND